MNLAKAVEKKEEKHEGILAASQARTCTGAAGVALSHQNRIFAAFVDRFRICSVRWSREDIGVSK
jgi:hypothetical protein